VTDTTDNTTDNTKGDIPTDPLGMTLADFTAAVRERGFGTGQAADAYRAVFREGKTEVTASRGRVIARVHVAPITGELAEEVGEGTTTKFLQAVGDGPSAKGNGKRPETSSDTSLPIADSRLPIASTLSTESVIIPMQGRSGRKANTLCVSSQVGCAMGCGFCETAQMGLIRSLSAAEIVGQWWAATHIKKAPINNIVFMGMGEPLDNLDAVVQAIAVLTERTGPCVPMASITISTVGRVDGLRRLAEYVRTDGWRRLGIAVSINAPNDQIRGEIMPINRKWSMVELRDALLDFRRDSSRKICFEYVLIPGVNDRLEHAKELAAYLEPFNKPLPGRTGRSPTGLINVIPYNPRRNSPWPAPHEEDVQRFIDALLAEGMFVKRRRTKGRSMMGACGQLGSAEIRKRRFVAANTGEAEPASSTHT
jgi:23S rRNA (adenine2503-C2)-methyltransferase